MNWSNLIFIHATFVSRADWLYVGVALSNWLWYAARLPIFFFRGRHYNISVVKDTFFLLKMFHSRSLNNLYDILVLKIAFFPLITSFLIRENVQNTKKVLNFSLISQYNKSALFFCSQSVFLSPGILFLLLKMILFSANIVVCKVLIYKWNSCVLSYSNLICVFSLHIRTLILKLILLECTQND